jgi:peptide chain release factor
MPLPDEDALTRRLKKLGIREDDLEEDFIRGSGPGGQKVNKTSSTVVLRHVPTGLEVRCQKERSQVMNRHWARVELCERLEKALSDARLAAQNEKEKVRRQNRPKPRGLKRKILKAKRNRGEVKRGRGKVNDD